MSDYEGDWENEWEPSQVNGTIPSIPPEPLLNYVGYKVSTLLSANQAAREKARKTRSPSVNIPSSYRPKLQQLCPGSLQTGLAFSRNERPIEQKHIQQRVLDLEAYKRFKNNESSPDDTYQMMHSFKEVARSLPKRPSISDLQVATDMLAETCISNAAFIRIPAPDESRLEIWGTPSQVEGAKRELMLWETYHKGARRTHTQAPTGFPKMSAYDGRAVERFARRQLQEHEQEAYQYYADDSMLPFEAHLVWPEGYDLEFFILNYDKEALDDLRRKYRCRIVHEEGDLRETVVSADNRHNMMQVYNRLIGLMKEMVTKKRRGVRATQCRLPDAQSFKDQVSLRPVQLQGISVPQIPELCGAPLPSGEIEQWNELKSRADKQYRKTMKDALRSCIKSLYVSHKHVRMRVSFGTIALHQYKHPNSKSNTYVIDDEFIAMTTESHLAVKQCPIVIGTSFDLIDRIDAMPEFGQSPQISWTLHFDFDGEVHGSRLRLEKEFNANPADPDEPSVAATRWVTFSQNTSIEVEDLLELSHMVIGEVGYQFNVGAAGMIHNQKVRQELRDIEGKISFKPSPNGQRFQPAKHVSFVKHPRLKSVVETTIARYTFRDTTGIFEVRRRDFFERSGAFGSVPDWTEWQAVYYYKDWDNLLGDFADTEPGGDVNWNRDLSTFFPKTVDEDNPKLLPNGYRNFMKEVEEIRTLLTRAAEGVPGSTIPEMKGKSKALNGGYQNSNSAKKVASLL